MNEKTIRRAILGGAAVVTIALTAYVMRPAEPTGYAPYVVEAGDTLWEIAETVTPKGEDVRRVVQMIKVQNAMKDSGVQIGELIDVPVWEGEKGSCYT